MNKKKHLASLQREWYKKLKGDGFTDIEYFDKDMEPRDMMYKEAIKFGLTAQDKFDSTEQYYLDAGQFLCNHIFDNSFDKQIWELHAAGESYRKIATQLNTYYPKVFKKINYYKDIMLTKYKVTP